jgi:hypothetical protein
LTWLEVGLAVGFYFLSGLGVAVGFHRYFTHRAFKANRGLCNGLAIAGSLAAQGDVSTWVADHRRHHAFAEKQGGPHSSWLFGTTPAALAKAFFHAHLGWLFDRGERTRSNAARFTPDRLWISAIASCARRGGRNPAGPRFGPLGTGAAGLGPPRPLAHNRPDRPASGYADRVGRWMQVCIPARPDVQQSWASRPFRPHIR